MDFYTIRVFTPADGVPRLQPDWVVGRTKDLMVRGKSFYAVWDEERGLWSTDEYEVQKLVDNALYEANERGGGQFVVMSMRDWSTQSWPSFRKYMQNIGDNSHQLDTKLTFANTEVQKSDYVSKRLPYSIEEGSTEAWDELLDVLYTPDERAKIEWAIGSVVSGESINLQKFFVFYGPAGSGKSTILNIVDELFDGYTTKFDAKALGGNNNAFSTEVFASNPLVAIQHDGDLSRIADNTKLNSVISHEPMLMNEKYKPGYVARINALLFLGTNTPVKISDAKSGLIRRLIDIHPSGKLLEANRYQTVVQQVAFEHGAIAHKCLQVFNQMGKHYYSAYRPVEMILQTDVFYNFVESIFSILKSNGGISLKRAYTLYKEWCDNTGVDKLMPQYKFREEFRNYFEHFEEKAVVDGETIYSYYSGFKRLKNVEVEPVVSHAIELQTGPSIFDTMYADQPAQLSKESGTPGKSWDRCTTKLSDVDTSKPHFVMVPEQHVVIDFDLTDEDGEKDLAINLEVAAKWPSTYTEVSRSGKGVHLHYIYTGDVTKLAGVYDVGIEVKTLLGKSSLRRCLTQHNNHEIGTLTSGLPIKEVSMIDTKTIKSEKSLRDLIVRNFRKEFHPGTKPSVDFIKKILDDAYASGISYDVSDMKADVLTFAAMSTNQSAAAIALVQQMNFCSEQHEERPDQDVEAPIVFFDVEVYPNLFVVCWKKAGESDVVTMVNPTPEEIEKLFDFRLVGFYNRRYDNHILYGAYLGKSQSQLYDLSDRLVNQKNNEAAFGEAYNLSYADIYDFSSKKQSLKKFEIELGIHHLELDFPWNEPVAEELWPKVVEYCVNDVVATEAVFNARAQDFAARQILADISGLTVNQTTQKHTAKIIFGDDRSHKDGFVYTDLTGEFPGYEFRGNESTYRGEVTGEGGYVYSEPGVYKDVALLDIASMHPTTIEVLNLFGEYTKNFSALKDARMAIKHGDYENAKKLLDGKLAPYLQDESDAEALSFALKIVINIVYGLTSAKFDNPFRDVRNKDNIVAKRGALFMVDLKHAVQEQGFTVCHVKTDSIKIPNATPEIIQFVNEFGAKYGYDFEHEATYEDFCLVNDAVYIARSGENWTAVGAQFQHPYVFKELFSGDDLEFEDFCEAKTVTQGSMYLHFGKFSEAGEFDESQLRHVGKTGSFVPVVRGGGDLLRIKEGKHYAVTGTKDHKWIESEIAKRRNEDDDLEVDQTYFEALKEKAIAAINKYGNFEEFVAK